jgi:predicted esterase
MIRKLAPGRGRALPAIPSLLVAFVVLVVFAGFGLRGAPAATGTSGTSATPAALAASGTSGASGTPEASAASEGAQTEDATPMEFATYADMRARMGELYREQRFAEAAAVLEFGLSRFPDHLMANAYNLALVYGHLARVEDGLKVLEQALDQGVWFRAGAFDPAEWDPYRELPGFAQVQTRSAEMLAEARKAAKPERLVVTPAGYDPQRRYPLFIALHGGGENIAQFKDNWTSPLMQSAFIVAYLQSSLLIAPDGYNWTEDLDVTRREVREAYDQILREYPIDPSRTIIGGFSSGGVASLEVAFGNTIPVAGFIVLCPAKPEGVTTDVIAAARARGLRGTLITTEMDNRIEDQKALAAMFAAAGLDCVFEVTPNIGHWYPDDLAERIDRGIEHILGERP